MPESAPKVFGGENIYLKVNMAENTPAVKAAREIGAGASGVRYTAKTAGEDGNSIRVGHVLGGGNNVPTSVAVGGSDVTVTVGTGPAGAANATAAQIRDAVNGNVQAAALLTASLIGDGSGIAAVSAIAALAGGADVVVPDPDYQIIAGQTGLSEGLERGTIEGNWKGDDHASSAPGRMNSTLETEHVMSFRNGTQARLKKALRDRELIVAMKVTEAFATGGSSDMIEQKRVYVMSVQTAANDDAATTFNVTYNPQEDWQLVA